MTVLRRPYALDSSTVFHQLFRINSEPHLGSSSGIVEVQEPIPFLSERAKSQIAKLYSFQFLERNWDGYNALPPSNSAIAEASRIARQLDELGKEIYFTAPGPDGEILIEVRTTGKEIEFYFNADGTNEVYIYEGVNLLSETAIENGNLLRLVS